MGGVNVGAFDTVMVANRGEIACRVIRTARQMGYRTVAVFSGADSDAPHVAMADVAVALRGESLAETYLDGAQLLRAAALAGAGAIHPGYGFLSENAAFAQSCVDAGLVFVGPPPTAIDAMGDKARSKARMREAGVPVVPGYEGPLEGIPQAAATLGYPILVKASAGGGGRGMRRVDHPDDLAAAVASASAEALAAFGDGTLLLERCLVSGRHVEVQVMADAHGAVVHLGERDCSAQRRHQKVLEEAPSPAVDAATRARMGAAACAAARAVGYVGAGTVEFLLEPSGSFYFLEMNTRLQVEHPVTELVTGVDLVAWQLDVARGRPLPAVPSMRGHAIEARLYAEDPARDFLPQTGVVVGWQPAADIRVDHGVSAGMRVSPMFDPMLAKLVAWGEDRDAARLRLVRALEQTVCLGVTTNRRFLIRCLRDEAFASGAVDVGTLERRVDLRPEAAVSAATVALAATLLGGALPGARFAHPLLQPMSLWVGDQRWEVVRRVDGVQVDGRWLAVELRGVGRVRVDGVERAYAAFRDPDGAWWVQHGDDEVRVSVDRPVARASASATDGVVRAPMAARVLQVPVAEGDLVAAGDVICVLEAMKIETRVLAPRAGRVREVRARAGASIAAGERVARIEEGE